MLIPSSWRPGQAVLCVTCAARAGCDSGYECRGPDERQACCAAWGIQWRSSGLTMAQCLSSSMIGWLGRTYCWWKACSGNLSLCFHNSLYSVRRCMLIIFAGYSGSVEERCYLRLFSYKAWVIFLTLFLVAGRLWVQVLGKHVPFYLCTLNTFIWI